VSSEGSPSDMSLWPSDMIADQASAPQSIRMRKRKDRIGQEGKRDGETKSYPRDRET